MPCALCYIRAVPPEYYASAGQSESQAQRPVRVLVIDDEPDTVVSLVTLLRSEGYEAKGANSGETAMRDLDSFDPDAVIVDIAMPGMTGWDVAREIRKMRGRRLTRPTLIAVSGTYVKKPDEMLARAAGFNYFLVKPCDPNFLFNILAAIVPGSAQS